MARVTIEDCLDNIGNRFDLVLVAAKRARQIANGAEVLVDEENDKPTVIALREIAEGLVDAESVEQIFIEVEDEATGDEAEENEAAKVPASDAVS